MDRLLHSGGPPLQRHPPDDIERQLWRWLESDVGRSPAKEGLGRASLRDMAKHSVNVPDGPGSISWGWLGGCEQHAAFSWPWGLSYWPSWRGGLFAWGIAGASHLRRHAAKYWQPSVVDPSFRALLTTTWSNLNSESARLHKLCCQRWLLFELSTILRSNVSNRVATVPILPRRDRDPKTESCFRNGT